MIVMTWKERIVPLRGLGTVCAILCACGDAQPAGHETPDQEHVYRSTAVLRGITVESVDELDGIVEAVAAHGVAPTVRIVFQADEPAARYARAVERLRPYAYLVGAESSPHFQTMPKRSRKASCSRRMSSKAFMSGSSRSLDMFAIAA